MTRMKPSGPFGRRTRLVPSYQNRSPATPLRLPKSLTSVGRRFVETVPLVILAALKSGTSAATSARRPTAPVVPSGVASTWLAVWPVAAVTASVPLDVTGDPDTVSQEGTERPTLVTVP